MKGPLTDVEAATGAATGAGASADSAAGATTASDTSAEGAPLSTCEATACGSWCSVSHSAASAGSLCT